MGPALAVISAVATVVGVATTIKSANEQKKAATLQQEQERQDTRRSQRMAIRERQIRQARLLALGADTGALGSSAISGGLGSLSSQTGEALGFSNMMSGLSQRITALGQSTNAWQGVSDLAFGFSKFASSRTPPKTTVPPQVNY